MLVHALTIQNVEVVWFVTGAHVIMEMEQMGLFVLQEPIVVMASVILEDVKAVVQPVIAEIFQVQSHVMSVVCACKDVSSFQSYGDVYCG